MLYTHFNTDKHSTELQSFRTIFGKSTDSYKRIIRFGNVRVVNEGLESLDNILTGTVVLAREWKNGKTIPVKVEVKWCVPVNYKAIKAKAILNSHNSQAN